MTADNFAVRSEDRGFEDYLPGAVFEYGNIRVTEAEIIEFARRYDPQYMHVDAEAAARGRFGGLVASGWHTAAVAMRLVVDNFLPKAPGLASPGLYEFRWLKPVRRRGVLCIRVSAVEAAPYRSPPEPGP